MSPPADAGPGRPPKQPPTLDQARTADARLAAALEASGAPDPRGPCRALLRELKRKDPDAYAKGVAFYQQSVVPSIASDQQEPLDAWLAYGLRLAELTAPGSAVAVDPRGRSRPFEAPRDPADLVLHLPGSSRARPLMVAAPAEPSGAQKAAVGWLVEGRRGI